MKRNFILLIFLIIMIIFVSCDKETVEDNVSETNEITTVEDSSEMIYAEDYSSELKEPDFLFPSMFSEAEKYMNLPQYDEIITGETYEKYIAEGVPVFTKSFTGEKISSITVYEADGETVAELYEYIYNDDGTTEIDIDYNKNGAAVSRRKYTFFSSGVIKSIYDMTGDSESGAPIVNTYEYNEKGQLVNCIDSDSFNQIIIDAIMNGLANG